MARPKKQIDGTVADDLGITEQGTELEIKTVRTKDMISIPGVSMIQTLLSPGSSYQPGASGGLLCESLIETDKGIIFKFKGRTFLLFNSVLSHIEYK